MLNQPQLMTELRYLVMRSGESHLSVKFSSNHSDIHIWVNLTRFTDSMSLLSDAIGVKNVPS